MAILSIQSWVAYGHVGNAVASFALQRLGMEVWAANTVNFSNHPGYGQWRGERAGGPAVTALVDGVASLGVLGQCEAVLSGYLGSADMAAAVLHAASLVRAANPAALYCCDPVIGDTAPGIYVEGAIPAFLRDRCLPAADILTPNHFELGFLSGRPVTSLAAAKDAANHLRHAMRPGGIVLVTSLLTPQTPAGAIDLLVVDSAGSHRLRTPLLPFGPKRGGGSGGSTLSLSNPARRDRTRRHGRRRRRGVRRSTPYDRHRIARAGPCRSAARTRQPERVFHPGFLLTQAHQNSDFLP